MCHVNLDMKQSDIEKKFGITHNMVVYYLSDLVGLALGLDETSLGIDRHFVVNPRKERPPSKVCVGKPPGEITID
jgi:heterodisulfide reductase subunit B